ncbi:MAG: DNA polymerase III subunit gamma/tau [Spirochaetota bacterium]
MTFEVTAAKRRPQVFSELAGQNFVVSTLVSSIQKERIAHAYLFSGPRGVGKTSAARILAKSLNCETGITENPCGRCSSCLEITSGNALDVIEIDGASNTSVNDVRAIKDEVLFAPNTSRYKIYIIDEVHMLSNSAFNALLKTIEEPPPYVIFIFATTEVHKVPATIRSRCQQYHFQLIALDVIIELLTQASHENGITFEQEALFWIAKEATGSLRDAYTLFDQVVSFCDGNIQMELIREKMGLVGVDLINTLAQHLASGRRGEAIALVQHILSQGISVEKCIIDLSEYFRTLLFIKEGITKEALIGARTSDYSSEVINSLESGQIEAALDLLLSLYRNIRFSLNSRFELELAISKLSSIGQASAPSDLYRELNSLKEELLSDSKKQASSSQQTRKPPRAPRQEQEQTRAETKPDEPNTPIHVQAKHFEILQAKVKQDFPSLASALQQIDSWSVDEHKVTLVFATSFAAERAKQRFKELSRQLSAILGAHIEVAITSKQLQEHEHKTPESGVTGDEAVELTKSIFRGEIEREK